MINLLKFVLLEVVLWERPLLLGNLWVMTLVRKFQLLLGMISLSKTEILEDFAYDFNFGIVLVNKDIELFLLFIIKVKLLLILDAHLIIIVYNVCSTA